jgi:hypothetical protein
VRLLRVHIGPEPVLVLIDRVPKCLRTFFHKLDLSDGFSRLESVPLRWG